MSSVALVCSEPLRGTMAGIAIRYTEMSRALAAAGLNVKLYAPDIDSTSYGAPEGVALALYTNAEALQKYDLIVVQGHLAHDVLGVLNKPMVVVDLYDPYLIEHASYIDQLGEQVFDQTLSQWQMLLREGDAFLYANQAQKMMYAGMLLATGGVPGQLIQSDPNLSSLLYRVPFGVEALSQRPNRTNGAPFKLFFGGVYDWYDPLILLEALDVPELADCQVIFVKSPNPDHTPQGQMQKILQWCADHHWGDERIAVRDWVAYQDRHQLLDCADAMIATHPNSLETELSMRTRFLDAIARGLPVITSAGGEIAALVTQYSAGIVVPTESVSALRDAIMNVKKAADTATISEPERLKFIQDWSWQNAVAPLVHLANHPVKRSTSPTTATQSVTTQGAKHFTVVLPTFNRMDIMPEVIAALENQFAPPSFDLIVINDGSTDATQSWLDAHQFSIPAQVIHQDNGGPARARNTGIDAAQGDYIVLLGDDTVPDRYWLNAHQQAHQRQGYDPAIIVVGHIDWHHRMHISRFIQFVDATGWQFAFNKIEDVNNLPFNYFYGSNLSLARTQLAKEQFNTSFPYPAWEDSELGYRLKLNGCRYVYDNGIRTEHLHKTTLARFAQRQRKAGYCAVVFNRLHPEVGAMVWPSAESFATASGPLMTTLRRWLAAGLSMLPLSLSTLWNNVFRDHYIQGIRDYCDDHNMALSENLSQGDQHLLPLTYSARSPLLQHQSGQLVDHQWVCQTGKHEAGHCVFGPNFRVIQDDVLDCRFDFVTNDAHSPHDAVTLDIYDNANDRVLTERSLTAAELDTNAVLSTSVVAGQRLEFRVFWHAKVDLYFRSITVSSAST